MIDHLLQARQRRVVQVAATAPRAPRRRARRAGPATRRRTAHVRELQGPDAGAAAPVTPGAAARPTPDPAASPLPAARAAHGRLEVVDRDRDAHPAGLERRPGAALLERRDPALPAAAPAPGTVAQPPRPRLDGARALGRRRRTSGRRSSVCSARDSAASIAGAVTVSRSSRRRTPATSSRSALHEALRLGAGRSHRLVALAAGPAALLVGRPQRLGGPRLGDPRPLDGLGDLALLACGSTRASPRTPAGSRVSRPRASATIASGSPSRSAIANACAAAGQADREPVRRRQRLEVELDRRVARGVGVSCA